MVEYNTSRKQTKIEIDDSLLNNCNERIIKTNSYLVIGEKKKKSDTGFSSRWFSRDLY